MHCIPMLQGYQEKKSIMVTATNKGFERSVNLDLSGMMHCAASRETATTNGCEQSVNLVLSGMIVTR